MSVKDKLPYHRLAIAVDSRLEPYHVEALVRILLCGLSAYTVDSGPLSCIRSGLSDTLNRSAQVIVKGTKHRTTNVVSQIPGPDKEHINARDLCNLLHLDWTVGLCHQNTK